MTDHQLASLIQLRNALSEATLSGLFDLLAVDVHPNVINTFCDTVQNFPKS